MKICGIDLKASNMILTVIENGKFLDLKVKKIVIENDESQNDIRNFCNEFLLFLEQNEIEKVLVKKRAKKGNFSGGAVTFKMEGLIQLNPLCEVELISSQSISSYERKNEIIFPENLKKYQEASYLTALTFLNQ